MAAQTNRRPYPTLMATALSATLMCPLTISQDAREGYDQEQASKVDSISWVQGDFENALDRAWDGPTATRRAGSGVLVQLVHPWAHPAFVDLMQIDVAASLEDIRQLLNCECAASLAGPSK